MVSDAEQREARGSEPQRGGPVADWVACGRARRSRKRTGPLCGPLASPLYRSLARTAACARRSWRSTVRTLSPVTAATSR